MVFRSLFKVMVLVAFFILPTVSSEAETDSTTVTTVTTAASPACTQAITDYYDADGAYGALCEGNWGAGNALWEWFKETGTAQPASCQAALSSCESWERSVAERGCLAKLAGESNPSQAKCEEVLRPLSPNQKCTIITSMDSAELARVDRDNQDLLRRLNADRTKAESESSSVAANIAKGLQEMQDKESDVRAKIAQLKATLAELGPAAQQELQTAYKAYFDSIDNLDLNFQAAVKRFNDAKVQRVEMEMAQKAKCQEAATTIFNAQRGQREGLNSARRNSTSLNNLTGNAQRFEANLKKYLDQCLQSEVYTTAMKQIANIYSMAETDYKNAQSRVQRMRLHLEENYQKNQALIQEKTRAQMQSLTEQMAALEQQIQQLRIQMISKQAQAEADRQTQTAGMEAISGQIESLNSSMAATSCVAACAQYLRPRGISSAFEDFEKMRDASSAKNRHCNRIRSLCTADHPVRVTAPTDCAPGSPVPSQSSSVGTADENISQGEGD